MYMCTPHPNISQRTGRALLYLRIAYVQVTLICGQSNEHVAMVVMDSLCHTAMMTDCNTLSQRVQESDPPKGSMAATHVHVEWTTCFRLVVLASAVLTPNITK